MKAIIYETYGPPEVLQLREVEKPVPKNNEVLIKVYATVVTTGDVRLRKADPFIVRTFNGLLKPKNKILGINFAGVIEETGKEVKHFSTSDEVYGSTVFEFGTYAEYICVPENGVIVAKPENITFDEAAAFPFGSLTSLHFLRKVNDLQGKRVLIYGASGSLGTAAVQLAKYFGADVTGVCSTSNFELVKSLGADDVIDYRDNGFIKSSRTYDVIYDTVGKSPFFNSVKKLNKKGIFLNAVHIPPQSLLKNLWLNITSSKKIIGGISVERKADLIFINDLMKKGKFKPVIDKRYPLEQISEAHRYVEQGHKKGNVVILVEHN